jgi:tetratricopeptide (TPR) repeat protein
MNIAIRCVILMMGVTVVAASLVAPRLDAAEPKLTEAERHLRRAYERAKTARSESDYTAIIDTCRDAVGVDTSDIDRQYAERLRAWALGQRATARSKPLVDADAVLVDYNESLAIDPRVTVFLARGDFYERLARWSDAASDYRAALRLDPKSAAANRSAAWLMATCPVETFRDQKLASESAQRAAELGDPADYRYLDTLAAAAANAGDFKQAKALQTRAIATASQSVSATKAELKIRLHMYQESKPYRMPASAPSTTASQRKSVK